MPTLASFTSISLDGYYADAKSDMSWAHSGNDAEFDKFTQDNAKGGGALLFGRITYDMMAGFWPTPAALQAFPVVAEQMNNHQKFVISRTLKDATWKNTTVLRGDLVTEIRQLKEKGDADMVILGSGSIVSQLGQAGLIDEYQVVVIPIVLGSGKKLFDGVKQRLALTRSHIFKNGKAFLSYTPQLQG